MKGIRIETDVESFAKEYEFDSSVQSIIDQQEGSIKPIFDEYKKEINILLAFVPDGVEEIVRKLKEQEEKYVLLFFIWCKGNNKNVDIITFIIEKELALGMLI